jgi:Bacterial Ig-like domain (group 3)/Dockerin type I domain
MKRISLAIFLCFLPAGIRGQGTTPPLPTPTPEISLSANGGATNLYSGWPLTVHVSIESADNGSTGSLTIAPQNQQWTSAVKFSAVSNTTGKSFQWPLTLAGTPSDAALTLASTDYVRAAWQLSAADVSALPADDYNLTATLTVGTTTGSGWVGTVTSEPLEITVGPEPDLTPDLQALKTFRQAEFSFNTGDVHNLVLITAQLYAAQPNNPDAASASADALTVAGYTDLAFLRASEALGLYYPDNATPPAEAPADLLTMHQNLFETLTTADATTPTTISSGNDSVIFSTVAQTVQLTAQIAGGSPDVEGGTVTFTVSGVGGSVVSGPVTNGAATAALTIPGGTHAGTYSIQAAYSGTTAFGGSSDASATLKISQATPTLKWNNPADISFGTLLGAAQLNATASVPGTLVYAPPSGTKLPLGASQALGVTFSPTNSVDYTQVRTSVSITVVSLFGDLNADGSVGCDDLAIIKASFGKRTGQAGFDPRADVNSDGIVNILDLSAVAKVVPAGTVCK